jgi:predicted outer membrane repeat protein
MHKFFYLILLLIIALAVAGVLLVFNIDVFLYLVIAAGIVRIMFSGNISSYRGGGLSAKEGGSTKHVRKT